MSDNKIEIEIPEGYVLKEQYNSEKITNNNYYQNITLISEKIELTKPEENKWYETILLTNVKVYSTFGKNAKSFFWSHTENRYKWSTTGFTWSKEWKPADMKELNKIFVQYIKENYPEGSTINCLLKFGKGVINHNQDPKISNNRVWIYCDVPGDNLCVYNDGVWAEVEIEKKENLKAYTGKFEVRDRVKVIRKADSCEGDWNNSWVSHMDKAVGNTYTILSTNGNIGYEFYETPKKFPEFVLELVEKPINKDKNNPIYISDLKPEKIFVHTCLNIDWIIRIKNNRNIQGGCAISTDSTYYTNNYRNDTITDIRYANDEEIKWLEACEKADKYIPKDKVIKPKYYLGEVGVWLDNKSVCTERGSVLQSSWLDWFEKVDWFYRGAKAGEMILNLENYRTHIETGGYTEIGCIKQITYDQLKTITDLIKVSL